jgi:UrcA family protein
MSKFVTIARDSLIAAAALSGSLPALADELPVTRVTYADLNLADSAGQHTLHTRVAGAARRVCAGNDGADLWAHRAYTSCLKRALSKANDQVAALLTGTKQVATR